MLTQSLELKCLRESVAFVLDDKYTTHLCTVFDSLEITQYETDTVIVLRQSNSNRVKIKQCQIKSLTFNRNPSNV